MTRIWLRHGPVLALCLVSCRSANKPSLETTGSAAGKPASVVEAPGPAQPPFPERPRSGPDPIEIGPEASSEPTPASEFAPTVADELIRWAGDVPVLLMHTREGLFATDGSRNRVLVREPIDAAGHDPRSHVLWAISGSRLLAVDLLASASDPVVVVDDLPEVSVSLPDAELWLGGRRVWEYLVLEWQPAPRIDVGLGVTPAMNEDLVDAIRGARLGNVDWLEQLADREIRPLPSPARAKPVAKAPHDCWSGDPCGVGVVWPNTNWKLYVTEYDSGDFRYWSCGLYDSENHRTADPSELPTPNWDESAKPAVGTCGPFYTSRDGESLAFADRLCRGSGCADLPGVALGFVEAGRTIVVEP